MTIQTLSYKRSLLLILFAVFACALFAQTPSMMESRIDSIFAEYNSPEKPGASVAVMHKGKILFSKGYGSANLEYGIPNGPETVFHVASVSKQFTAFAILLLQERGKLSIDDDIRKHIPEVPDFGTKITLRHLVTHTSGMRDQWNLLAIAGWRLDDVITKDHVMELVSRQQDLNFEPGEEYVYCNTGFTLLAEVVARISGKSFAEFTQEEIFTPLGMKHSFFFDDHERIVKNRAYSYYDPQGTYQKRRLNYANVGATSLFTTAEDLVTWTQNFIEPKVGNASIFKQMNTEAVLNDGNTFGGAMGQFISPYRGLNQIQHGGADAAYRSYLARFPDQEFAVAVASNYGEFNPNAKAMAVVDLYLGDQFKDAPIVENTFGSSDQAFVKLKKKQLKAFEAWFWNDASNYSRRIYLRKDTLRYARGPGNESPLMPISDNEFQMLNVDVDLKVKFLDDDAGKRMEVRINGAEPIISRGYEPTNYGPDELASFEGDYYSKELDATYRLMVKDKTLIAKHIRNGEVRLSSIMKDRFMSNRWYMGNINFERDANGKISGFKVSAGRVRNVKFIKLEQAPG